MAKINLYAVYDSVADESIVFGTANTDGMFIRQNIPYFERMNPNYLQDFSIYCIGSIVGSTLEVTGCPKRLVSWDSYTRPEQNEGKLVVSKDN